MKNKYIFSLIGLLCSLSLGYGQILTIVEKNGGRVDTVKVYSAQIIDINGNLEISISKTELLKRLRTSHPELGNQLKMQEHIDALEKALINQETLLERLKQQTLNTADKKAFYKELDDLYKTILEPGNEDLLKQTDDLLDEYFQKYGPNSENPNSGLKKEVYILTNFNQNLNLAKQNLANANGKSFAVSMIANIYSNQGENRVHIENFDAIAESEIYTVPRWVSTLSGNQAKKLQELQNRTETYKNDAPKVFDSFKIELLSKLPDLSCIGNIKSDFQNFTNNANVGSANKDTLNKYVQPLVTEIDGLTSLVNLLKQNISSWTITTPFEVFAQIKTLARSTKNIENNFKQFKSKATTFDRLVAKLDPLVESFDGYYKPVLDEVTKLENALSILKNQQKRFKDNDEIGDAVKKFTLNDLPSTGYIKLERSGPRKKGDELEVVLVLRLPQTENAGEDNSRSPLQKNEILESRPLTMQLTGLRTETVIGVIMGDSYNENSFTPLSGKRFLYAPSASLLLKVGSRKSKKYNDFIDFGLGLSLSTPDFDTDGSPEFGAGVMFTAFKNIFNIGLNYNVTLDTPYWSFGVNLPFSLPGIPTHTPR